MLSSPKMQRMHRGVRINDSQLLGLAEKAKYDSRMTGYLYKRSSDSSKWLLRWFRLYQNLLFYYDIEAASRPSGVIFLEGCYCERQLAAPNTNASNASNVSNVSHSDKEDKMVDNYIYCFAIMYRRENARQYELRASDSSECQAWIDHIKMASFNKLHLAMQELEHKHLHLLQVVESEKTAKWQYTQHCDELTEEIKKLRHELFSLKKEWRVLPHQRRLTSSAATTAGTTSGTKENFELVDELATEEEEEGDADIAKIKKVQSFFRGWLCRRRWKQIVDEYIRSPHAESMRKRNCLVFRMVEAEEEYVEQLEILVSCFLRPFKMAASSKSPPCTHEDINSIFLNAETLLFLHQIFLKGLTARMESWPTLVLGDLFDMLLPMLTIYQEYVRNHHYCLQVLTECKQSPGFAQLLSRLEKKPACKGRSLETFLTYPMHQIPRYIITLHELLAHTPPDHVEKKSLEHARMQLEDLSRQMHDEVSDTENIRKNLAIERMIVEGCDILLDVNQMFVRQGTLIQILHSSHKSSGRTRLPSGLVLGREREREAVRQCFLFSNHLIITMRTQAGRLHLVDTIGRINLADVILIEDPNDDDTDSSPTWSDISDNVNKLEGSSRHESSTRCHDFKLIVDDLKASQQLVLHLVAPSKQEKAAWITDISQCMDTVHFNGLFYNTLPNASGNSLPQAVKSDPNLFKDDVDIRFSKTFSTCKIPQIRYATPERLLQRLTDLRFLNIDFLNTFLLTYRVFTNGLTVLQALKKVFYEPPNDTTVLSSASSSESLENMAREETGKTTNVDNTNNAASVNVVEEERRRISTCSTHSTGITNNLNAIGLNRMASPRRISGASSVSQGYFSDERQVERQIDGANNALTIGPPAKTQHWRYSFRRYEEEQRASGATSRKNSGDSLSSVRGVGVHNWRKESVTIVEHVEPIKEAQEDDQQEDQSEMANFLGANDIRRMRRASSVGEKSSTCDFLAVPTTITASSSAETLTDNTLTAPSTPIKAGDLTFVNGKINNVKKDEKLGSVVDVAVIAVPTDANLSDDNPQQKKPSISTSTTSGQVRKHPSFSSSIPYVTPRARSTSTFSSASYSFPSDDNDGSDLIMHTGSRSQPCSHHPSFSSGSGSRSLFAGINLKELASGMKSPTKELRKRKGLFQRHVSSSTNADSSDCGNASPITSPQHSKMGVVVTSSRQAHRRLSKELRLKWSLTKAAARQGCILSQLSEDDDISRSSSANAAVAFAVATAGSGNPPDPVGARQEFREAAKRKCSITSNAGTMRVLSVLRHWVTKHFQDFENNSQLKSSAMEFLEDIVCSPTLLPAEHRASSQLLRMLSKEETGANSKSQLHELLKPPQNSSKESVNTLSALEIAEQMAFLDQSILFAIHSSEFLGQAWAKQEKGTKAPSIVLMTRRFNDMSRLVVSEIMTQSDTASRVQVIEKWAAVADICRCLHNFNGVLQICAAFTNSSVYRLKGTWQRVSKSVKQTVDKLQSLVSSDGRFRNLRDALHRTDPPCIPYLGMYLSDLTFIEEGTPNFTDNGLLNFAKMRMIAHVIREIRQFQQTPYKIEGAEKVLHYILDQSKLLDDDDLYERSLVMEPRSSRLSSSFSHVSATASLASAAMGAAVNLE